METKTREKIEGDFFCEKCNYRCKYNSDFVKHTMTAKHKMETFRNKKSRKLGNAYNCKCGKIYSTRSGLWKHKQKCGEINVIVAQENMNEKPSLMDVITQNKELMNLLVLQNQEHKKERQQFENTIQEMVPKIGDTNITNNNNNFNLQLFLNEDCKDALNFSEFIDTMKISFEDLENQANIGYIKGISKLFIENLQELGTHKRPIHCTDKKRKTLYIKENNSWDKEGSQDSLKKGIQEVTRKTQKKLLEEKENNSEEYKDSDSEFFEKCINIQRNLIPDAPRETTINKVIENISKTSEILEK